MSFRTWETFLAGPEHYHRNQRIAESLRIVPAIQQLRDGGQVTAAAIFSKAGLLAVLNDQQSRALADALHDTFDQEER